MIADRQIQELVNSRLRDNHDVDGVGFMDELLQLAWELAEIRCQLADEDHLRFEFQDRTAWECQLGRAKSKLRLLCARLAVLCNESGGQDISIYGGEGVIREKRQPELATNRRLTAEVTAWTVRFKNTMAQQEFVITPMK
jgi:hypothetical protein